MSSQRFRLHRSVPAAAALTLAFLLASPPASWAAPQSPAPPKPSPSITDPGAAAARFLMNIGTTITSGLRSIFQASDTATGDAVDPWDDDLGKKPPQ
jgi:hypothetical protein